MTNVQMSGAHAADGAVVRPLAGDDPAKIIESPLPGLTDEALEKDLAPDKPVSRKVSVLTRILAALALVSVGLVGGVLLDRHFGSGGTSGGAGNGTLQGGFGSGGFPTGGFGGGGNFTPPTGGGGGGFGPPSN